MKRPAVRIAKRDLLAFTAAIFTAAGVERAVAQTWAEVLVWANLRGVDSHGILRIPRYLDLLAAGDINRTPQIRIERRAGAVAVMDADRAPGAAAMVRAMEEAVACARDAGVGWCAARGITHAGAIGYFALQAAQSGMIGLTMVASTPLMAYHGARAAGLSTNPIAIAVPAGKRPPFLLDMSTSTVSYGKVLSARDQGIAVPQGWGIDAEGRDTTDPKKIATLLPLGGAKGSGLSFMIECLCSLTVGNPVIALALAGDPQADSMLMNGVALAVDPAAFGTAETFAAEADRFGDAIAALPPAEGVERVLLPGERGDEILRTREAEGIPIPQGTWSRIVEAAERVGVPAPVSAASAAAG